MADIMDEVWGAVPADSMDYPNAVICLNIAHMGRMISGSKADYARKHPQNIVVFNANVLVDGKKVWYGDLDVTKDEKKLQKCADTIGKNLYILPEMAARFDKENKPDMTRTVKVFTPTQAV